jgi:1-pyrroline-5-carboxylate dehydrogenase
VFQPFDHQKKVAKFYWATPELIQKAIAASQKAKVDWERTPMSDRMQLFLNVADQLSTVHRADMNAATMLGQAKTLIQVDRYLPVRSPVNLTRE